MKFKSFLCVSVLVLTVSFPPPADAAKLKVAVFNFQMKSDTADWVWAEKGLADQITTDFTGSRRISVVARDEMQVLARKMHWVPEMATADPRRMEEIREALKIDYLVTGIYTVVGDRIEITALVVNVETREEKARKQVAGAAKNVLDLQKRVSAELLEWFSGVPAAEILPNLPVWSKKVSATKALYEGLHLYDEGRYEDAWLKFRQAWRSDPDYLEAHYWVGRMYYFMDRYEHARRAYERFVYMDSTHPRIGDAIKEYLHTYEKLNAPPETLLKLYEDFGRRFPEVLIYNEVNEVGPVKNRAWLKARSAQVLERLGRHEEAVIKASEAMEEIRQNPASWDEEGWAYHIAMENAQDYNLLTGKVLVPKGLAAHHRYGDNRNLLLFEPGSTETTYLLEMPEKIDPTLLENGQSIYSHRYFWFFILAPDGHVFKTLSIYPIIDGTDAKVGCAVHKDTFADVGSCGDTPVELAAKNGFNVGDFPRCGIFELNFWLVANDRTRDPKVVFRGVRLVAEWEKPESFGSIYVDCSNTPNFMVRVGPLRGRAGRGLIGLVPPGEYTLTFMPASCNERYDKYYGDYAAKVKVEAGKTATVIATLPWNKGSPWSSWSKGTLVGRDYPESSPCLQTVWDGPTITADDQSIRVFWSFCGDLWWSKSEDGETFSAPMKLPMPVSTGWIEQNPTCLRDESGRYLLAFRSDREAQHMTRAYICWSRDALNWSRPAMVIDRAVGQFGMIQDNKGRYIWADATEGKVTILSSRDAYQWEKCAELPLDGEAAFVCILQRNDGKYELFAESIRYTSEDKSPERARTRVLRWLSSDRVSWTGPEILTELSSHSDGGHISASHVDGSTFVFYCVYVGVTPMLRMFREKPGGGWDAAPSQDWFMGQHGSMSHHPRWGYMIAWSVPPLMQFPIPHRGPYFLRGKSVDQFFGPK